MRTPRILACGELANTLSSGGVTLVQGCSATSDMLAGEVRAAGAALGDMAFTGIQVPGINRASWLANPASTFTTFFMTPELNAAGDAVRFLPLCYTDILRHLRAQQIRAALFSVTPPDSNGICSFGPTVDFLAELWPTIPIRIAQINPMLPRTSGPTGIPYADLHAVIEGESPLPEMADPAADAVTSAIAAHAGKFIGDGATIQSGLGKLPGVILRALGDRRRLRVHSGLIGDAVLDLIEGGAISGGTHVTAGVAIGTQRLYDALPTSGIAFHPVSHTHAIDVLARIPDFVAINAALEVDLYGQAYAEAMPTGWNSGPGGASDFARGALAAGGLRLVVLPSAAKAASRIVPAGGGRGPVSLGRTDIDIVVTEQGAADLRGRSPDERAAALIGIAHPDHRETLARGWRDGPGVL